MKKTTTPKTLDALVQETGSIAGAARWIDKALITRGQAPVGYTQVHRWAHRIKYAGTLSIEKLAEIGIVPPARERTAA